MGDLRIDVPCLPVCKQVKLTPYPPHIYRPFPNLKFFFSWSKSNDIYFGDGVGIKSCYCKGLKRLAEMKTVLVNWKILPPCTSVPKTDVLIWRKNTLVEILRSTETVFVFASLSQYSHSFALSMMPRLLSPPTDLSTALVRLVVSSHRCRITQGEECLYPQCPQEQVCTTNY